MDFFLKYLSKMHPLFFSRVVYNIAQWCPLPCKKGIGKALFVSLVSPRSSLFPMTHCSSWLMAWLISSYLLPWSLQMFAQLPLVPAGYFTQLYLVSFNLNLFCPLFLLCFLCAGHLYSAQYLPRAKRYCNTTLVTADDCTWILLYWHRWLLDHSFKQQTAVQGTGL